MKHSKLAMQETKRDEIRKSTQFYCKDGSETESSTFLCRETSSESETKSSSFIRRDKSFENETESSDCIKSKQKEKFKKESEKSFSRSKTTYDCKTLSSNHVKARKSSSKGCCRSRSEKYARKAKPKERKMFPTAKKKKGGCDYESSLSITSESLSKQIKLKSTKSRFNKNKSSYSSAKLQWPEQNISLECYRVNEKSKMDKTDDKASGKPKRSRWSCCSSKKSDHKTENRSENVDCDCESVLSNDKGTKKGVSKDPLLRANKKPEKKTKVKQNKNAVSDFESENETENESDSNCTKVTKLMPEDCPCEINNQESELMRVKNYEDKPLKKNTKKYCDRSSCEKLKLAQDSRKKKGIFVPCDQSEQPKTEISERKLPNDSSMIKEKKSVSLCLQEKDEIQKENSKVSPKKEKKKSSLSSCCKKSTDQTEDNENFDVQEEPTDSNFRNKKTCCVPKGPFKEAKQRREVLIKRKSPCSICSEIQYKPCKEEEESQSTTTDSEGDEPQTPVPPCLLTEKERQFSKNNWAELKNLCPHNKMYRKMKRPREVVAKTDLNTILTKTYCENECPRCVSPSHPVAPQEEKGINVCVAKRPVKNEKKTKNSSNSLLAKKKSSGCLCNEKSTVDEQKPTGTKNDHFSSRRKRSKGILNFLWHKKSAGKLKKSSNSEEGCECAASNAPISSKLENKKEAKRQYEITCFHYGCIPIIIGKFNPSKPTPIIIQEACQTSGLRVKPRDHHSKHSESKRLHRKECTSAIFLINSTPNHRKHSKGNRHESHRSKPKNTCVDTCKVREKSHKSSKHRNSCVDPCIVKVECEKESSKRREQERKDSCCVIIKPSKPAIQSRCLTSNNRCCTPCPSGGGRALSRRRIHPEPQFTRKRYTQGLGADWKAILNIPDPCCGVSLQRTEVKKRRYSEHPVKDSKPDRSSHCLVKACSNSSSKSSSSSSCSVQRSSSDTCSNYRKLGTNDIASWFSLELYQKGLKLCASNESLECQRSLRHSSRSSKNKRPTTSKDCRSLKHGKRDSTKSKHKHHSSKSKHKSRGTSKYVLESQTSLCNIKSSNHKHQSRKPKHKRESTKPKHKSQLTSKVSLEFLVPQSKNHRHKRSSTPKKECSTSSRHGRKSYSKKPKYKSQHRSKYPVGSQSSLCRDDKSSKHKRHSKKPKRKHRSTAKDSWDYQRGESGGRSLKHKKQSNISIVSSVASLLLIKQPCASKSSTSHTCSSESSSSQLCTIESLSSCSLPSQASTIQSSTSESSCSQSLSSQSSTSQSSSSSQDDYKRRNRKYNNCEVRRQPLNINLLMSVTSFAPTTQQSTSRTPASVTTKASTRSFSSDRNEKCFQVSSHSRKKACREAIPCIPCPSNKRPLTNRWDRKCRRSPRRKSSSSETTFKGKKRQPISVYRVDNNNEWMSDKPRLVQVASTPIPSNTSISKWSSLNNSTTSSSEFLNIRDDRLKKSNTSANIASEFSWINQYLESSTTTMNTERDEQKKQFQKIIQCLSERKDVSVCTNSRENLIKKDEENKMQLMIAGKISSLLQTELVTKNKFVPHTKDFENLTKTVLFNLMIDTLQVPPIWPKLEKVEQNELVPSACTIAKLTNSITIKDKVINEWDKMKFLEEKKQEDVLIVTNPAKNPIRFRSRRNVFCSRKMYSLGSIRKEQKKKLVHRGNQTENYELEKPSLEISASFVEDI